MSGNGEFALAQALNSLATTHTNTQLIVGTTTIFTADNYLSLVTNWSSTLSYDQQQCSTYTENATVGNLNDSIEAAQWREQYQVDSTGMNQAIGRQNATMNSEEMQMHTQSQNLTPVYSVLEYVSLLFLTTSGLLTRQ